MQTLLRQWRILLLLVLLSLTLPLTATAWTRNIWSLQVMQQMAQPIARPGSLPTTTVSHPREAAWQGLWALEQGDVQASIMLLLASPHDPKINPLAALVLADAYEQAGEMALAVTLWRDLGAWRRLLMAGSRATATYQLDDAILYFQAAWQLEPLETTGHLAEALMAARQTKEAEQLLRQALTSNPRHAQSQLWRAILGRLLSQEKRWAEAIGIYQEALQIDPSYAAAHIGLGQALYYSGQGIETALVHVKQGIALKPNDVSGYIAVGGLLEAEKRHSEAAVWYQRAAELDPSGALAVTGWVDSLLAANRVNEALDLLSQAILKFPTERHLYYQLGQAYRRQGNLDLAIAAAQRSVALDRSGNAGYRAALGALYEQAGRLPEAIQMYQAALALDPNRQDAQEGLRRVQR